MHGIIQCALWCKGYYAELGLITGQYKGQTAASVKELKSDIGFTSGVTSTVTIEIMEQLLSMKQFVLLSNQGGRSVIRSIQQKINREYKNYTGIIPCDGLDFSSLQELAYSVGAKMLGASSQLLVVFWELSTSIEKAHSCVSFACYLWNKIH